MSPSDGPRAEDPDSSAGVGEELGDGLDDVEPVGRRKIVWVSAASVVVLAVVGLVVYLLTSGDDSGDDTAGPGVPTIEGSAPPAGTIPSSPPAGSTQPLSPRASASSPSEAPPPPPQGEDAVAAESVAEQAASAISSADVTTLAELSCDPSSVGTEETFPANARAEVIGEPQIDGDTATVDIRLTIEGAEPTTVPIPLTRLDGRWCIP